MGLRVTNKRGMERMVFSDARVHVREATRSIHGSDHASLTRTLFAEPVNVVAMLSYARKVHDDLH